MPPPEDGIGWRVYVDARFADHERLDHERFTQVREEAKTAKTAADLAIVAARTEAEKALGKVEEQAKVREQRTAQNERDIAALQAAEAVRTGSDTGRAASMQLVIATVTVLIALGGILAAVLVR